MPWNHRIMAHNNGDNEVYFQIHEVYYDENGSPNSYTVNPVTIGGEDLESIEWTLNKMLESLNKPILSAGENFPNEYKINK
jgi:hypothetical protein